MSLSAQTDPARADRSAAAAVLEQGRGAAEWLTTGRGRWRRVVAPDPRGLVAMDARLSLAATTTLATLLGIVHGHLNGSALAQPGLGLVGLIGIVAAVFTVVALAASFVVPLREACARVAVRVLGSWIAAIGLLLIGWGMRSSA